MPDNGQEGVVFVDPAERPPGSELVPSVEAPPGMVAVRDIGVRKMPYMTRALSPQESSSALERVLQARKPHASTEDLEAKRLRELQEADVVEAARRSQAEIRRHVDAYLREHFEHIAADVAEIVIKRTNETLLKGVAGMQEQQFLQLCRIATDVRAQLRAFVREGWVGVNRTKPVRKAKPRAKRRT